MKLKMFVALVLAAATGVALASNVSNTETTFAQVYDLIDGWLTGTLGKTIAISSLAVGLAIGIVKQSIMAVAIGIAMALALSMGPGVISGVFNAVL